MTKDEVETIVSAVLAEQKRLHSHEADEVVLQTISTILTSFGIEEEDRQELRADFRHLRGWRKASEKVTNAGIIATVTILIGGFLGAVWLGVKAILGR